MSKNYQTIETSLNKEVVGITLPTAFEVYTKQLFGEERYNIFLKGLQQSSSVSIRLNPFKTSETTQIANSFEPIPIAWCKEGFYLNVRPKLYIRSTVSCWGHIMYKRLHQCSYLMFYAT